MATDLPDLPNDAAALQQMLLRTLAQLDATRTELAAKEHELQRVRHWLEQLLRHRFGRKGGRVDENQLFLFAVEIASTGQEVPPPPPSEAPKSKPTGHGRRRLPPSLERPRRGLHLAPPERQVPPLHRWVRPHRGGHR